jgi:amidase
MLGSSGPARDMSTFIRTYETQGSGVRLAVKDLIDLAGELTTAGCKAVADRAEPAAADAVCMAGARQAGAVVVGKTNLSELAYDAVGDNPWYGTPVNPLDPGRIPGGSSSGSAVAVGSGQADVAYGSDTGGSVRIPSACCGTVGLKTTFGRVPLEGVWPLAQSLDTVGPMAASVAGVVTGMALLEPGFVPASAPAAVVGRLRPPGVDPDVDRAVDRALAQSELDVVEVVLDRWDTTTGAFVALIASEAWRNDRHLLDDPASVSPPIAQRLAAGAGITDAMVAEARRVQAAWRAEIEVVLSRVEVLALPTLLGLPPVLGAPMPFNLTALTSPFNLSGSPAIALAVPVAGSALPASLQLVGPQGGEELLCATAAVVEAAVAR